MISRSSGLFNVGKLGAMELQPGAYIYTGSAFGPGGLRGRLAHHLVPAAKPHWHIDYLRQHANLVAVWWVSGPERREEQWAAGVHAIRGARQPICGFGASDTSAPTHLCWFRRQPTVRTFLRRLRTADPSHPPVRVATVRSSARP